MEYEIPSGMSLRVLDEKLPQVGDVLAYLTENLTDSKLCEKITQWITDQGLNQIIVRGDIVWDRSIPDLSGRFFWDGRKIIPSDEVGCDDLLSTPRDFLVPTEFGPMYFNCEDLDPIEKVVLFDYPKFKQQILTSLTYDTLFGRTVTYATLVHLDCIYYVFFRSPENGEIGANSIQEWLPFLQTRDLPVFVNVDDDKELTTFTNDQLVEWCVFMDFCLNL